LDLTPSAVTGSSRGIGASITLRLAAQGADVVINYVTSATKADETAAEIRKQHAVKVITIQADVSNDEDVAHLFEETKKQLGRIDIVMVTRSPLNEPPPNPPSYTDLRATPASSTSPTSTRSPATTSTASSPSTSKASSSSPSKLAGTWSPVAA
jgi:NAD(P)-dependent dehydrogenase (short-subunit alcohol dehydrogenase family)